MELLVIGREQTRADHTEKICIAATSGRAEKHRRHVFFQKAFYSTSIPLWRKKESDLAAWEYPMDTQALRQLPQMIFPFSPTLLRFYSVVHVLSPHTVGLMHLHFSPRCVHRSSGWGYFFVNSWLTFGHREEQRLNEGVQCSSWLHC